MEDRLEGIKTGSKETCWETIAVIQIRLGPDLRHGILQAEEAQVLKGRAGLLKK